MWYLSGLKLIFLNLQNSLYNVLRTTLLPKLNIIMDRSDNGKPIGSRAVYVLFKMFPVCQDDILSQVNKSRNVLFVDDLSLKYRQQFTA